MKRMTDRKLDALIALRMALANVDDSAYWLKLTDETELESQCDEIAADLRAVVAKLAARRDA